MRTDVSPRSHAKINGEKDSKKDSYYENGSTKVAEVSAVSLRKLETRRKLTGAADRLVICLVGLPGRGKSFIARKLQTYLNWRGTECVVFNVGKYRRQAQADLQQALSTEENDIETDDKDITAKRKAVGACDANFFDANNPLAKEIRTRAAAMAMNDMIVWLQGNPSSSLKSFSKSNYSNRARFSLPRSVSGLKASDKKARVAIFDATNSTAERRKWVLEQLNTPSMKIGVIFVESVCDDKEMLEENFRFKVQNSPDFADMTLDEAMDDLRRRVEKYEEQYETIQDDNQSYIKIFNLSSKLLVNHVYGRMAKVVVPSLMSWNIGSRPIFLCRAGETGRSGDDFALTSSPKRGGTLNESGQRFRDALAQFITREGHDLVAQSENAMKEALAFVPSTPNTGTSLSGMASNCEESFPFTCHVMTSTMPRAVETATWESLPFEINELPNLNPLDRGDFSGMELEEIRQKDPTWYEELKRDSFLTRFPGGECYKDLILRLETSIIDMEQQVNMVCVVSHISVLQVLISYFNRTPIEKCSTIQVPMHTVIKFTPVTGGSWVMSQHALGPEIGVGGNKCQSDESRGPIWGDHQLLRTVS